MHLCTEIIGTLTCSYSVGFWITSCDFFSSLNQTDWQVACLFLSKDLFLQLLIPLNQSLRCSMLLESAKNSSERRSQARFRGNIWKNSPTALHFCGRELCSIGGGLELARIWTLPFLSFLFQRFWWNLFTCNFIFINWTQSNAVRSQSFYRCTTSTVQSCV